MLYEDNHMMTQERRITLHGMLLQIPYWFGCSIYFAFIVTTLIDNGWSESAATGATTVISVIVMLVQPFFGYLCDKFFSEKKLTIVLLIFAAASFFLLPLSLESGKMALVFLNMAGITVSIAQVCGFIDAWVVGLKQEYPSVNYGLIRGTGSLAFAISAQVAGILTTTYGHNVRLWVGFGSLIIAIFVALSFRAARSVNQDDKNSLQRLTGLTAIKLVFTSKQYNLLLAVSFFLLLSNSTMLTLNQLLVRELGGTAAQIGTTTAVMAVSEVPFMFLMAIILKKVGFKKIIILCSAIYVARMLITASVNSVNGLICAQLLQGLTYAVIIPASMSYLSQILDERVRSTAVTTYVSVTNGLTGILGSLITASLLASGFSAQSALIVFSVSAGIGFCLAFYGMFRKIW